MNSQIHCDHAGVQTGASDDEKWRRTKDSHGTSACLLGQVVRFDGQHQRNRFVTDTLKSLVDIVPVCPELELGMGIPREMIRFAKQEKHGKEEALKLARQDVTNPQVKVRRE